jgi:hypothetical protein
MNKKAYVLTYVFICLMILSVRNDVGGAASLIFIALSTTSAVLPLPVFLSTLPCSLNQASLRLGERRHNNGRLLRRKHLHEILHKIKFRKRYDMCHNVSINPSFFNI